MQLGLIDTWETASPRTHKPKIVNESLLIFHMNGFVCVAAIRLSVNNFSVMSGHFCLIGLNQYKAEYLVSCSSLVSLELVTLESQYWGTVLLMKTLRLFKRSLAAL